MAEVIAGRVELLEPVAQGASGWVWRARDLKRDRDCAAKVLQQRDSANILRFVREQSVRNHALAAHPHVIAPYSWVAEDDAVAILMPLARGGTLSDVLATNGALSPDLTFALLRQLCDALAAIHAAGWIHRDVKPANILFTAPCSGLPEVRLADFGIALQNDDHRFTATGFVNGTPGFMAPEQVTEGAFSAAVDVWAAASVALDCLAPRQRIPNSAQTSFDALSHHVGSIMRPAGASSEQAALIMAMLDPDPLRRPSAAQVRDAIPPMPPELAAQARTATGAVVQVGSPAADDTTVQSRAAQPTGATSAQPSAPTAPSAIESAPGGGAAGGNRAEALGAAAAAQAARARQQDAPTAQSSPTAADSPTVLNSPTGATQIVDDSAGRTRTPVLPVDQTDARIGLGSTAAPAATSAPAFSPVAGAGFAPITAAPRGPRRLGLGIALGAATVLALVGAIAMLVFALMMNPADAANDALAVQAAPVRSVGAAQ
ncbi:serine/threonine protein kinase [Helcobacillus massiliensis]|uniref:serine/threonine-protein kinase n=1 Tax=Helcobacillus massiliensis TaxID=521392 RepID=UPI0021A7A1EC|nr:serine/threonine-protein kinase [Helcobacillus massiliensis]MCT1557704.1 serine/threonine protein kinase [Helcobacillus massiliensis]MCT2035976.1 serine/threonine protein kinase [Helcobacillus massiliensis]MCT2331754.1 serine/threonine protein kinase [Helcobacillus massiliensis]